MTENLAVVPADGGTKAAPSFRSLLAAAAGGSQKKVAAGAGKVLTADEAYQLANEEPVPVEWTWHVLQKAKMESSCIRLVLYVAFVAIFVIIFQMVRPVDSTFAMQDALLEQTTRAGASVGASFYDISSDAEWFLWVETKLIPTIMDENFFNGHARAKTWGQRFVNTVAMYNTMTVPIRFRQVRVTDDSCDTPADSSQLSRPCWGQFTTRRQLKTAFGEYYGSRYLVDLNDFGYGTEGHVVDIQLDKPLVMHTVSQMKQGLWLSEGTRMTSIETSWYNANLDLSTYVRWQLEISPGGLFRPSVVLLSCRLEPYSTTLDHIRMCLEAFFCVVLLYYFAEAIFDVHAAYKAVRLRSHLLNLWTLFEWANLAMYIAILGVWLRFLGEEKGSFQAVSYATMSARPDLSGIASQFNTIANMAAFNIFFAHLKVFKYLQIVPSLDTLWRALSGAARDTWPFLFIFLLFTCGFTFAGHWIFGLMMPEFHTWPRAFATLFLTLVGGYPYDDMRFVAPISAWIFTLCWVLVAVMVLANMFVAILAEWYRRVLEEREMEEVRLRRKIGRQSRSMGSLLNWLISLIPSRGDLMGRVGIGSGPALGLKELAPYRDIRRLLRGSDLRDTENVRQALLNGKDMVAADLAGHFGGNARGALEFVKGVQALAETSANSQVEADANGDFGDVGDFRGQHQDEAGAQEQLQSLQMTVERLEHHINQLRKALHEASAAPLKDGQALQGFVEMPRGEVTMQSWAHDPADLGQTARTQQSSTGTDARGFPAAEFTTNDLPGVVQD